MMSEVDLPDLVQEALKRLSEKELEKMEHCVGFDRKKVYHRKGFAYFRPYRNHFYTGGTDREIWAGIKKKGYAESGRDDQYMPSILTMFKRFGVQSVDKAER